MSHATLTIRSNIDTVSPVFVNGLGFQLEAGGSEPQSSNDDETLTLWGTDLSLAALASDNAFPASADLTTNSVVITDDGGNPVDPEEILTAFVVPVEFTNMLTTGLLVGGALTINGGDATKFDVDAGEGLVVNNHSDPEAPVVKRVSWTAFTAQAPSGLGSTLRTYIAIDSAGAVVQQTSDFTPTQRRDLIILGSVAHSTGAAIDSAACAPIIAYNKHLEAIDFIEALGPINISGNVYGNSGANLNIDKSSGSAFRLGRNYAGSKKTPSITSDGVLSPAAFFYTHQDGGGGFTILAPGTTIDPDNYDDGSGGLIAVPAGEWTIQQIFFFAGSTVTGVHYGQQTFATKMDALANLQDPIVLNPEAENAVFRSWLVVKEGALDLSDLAEAEFVSAGRLGLASVTAGAGGTGESNTITNEGAGGVGVFKTKTGVNFELRNIAAGSSKISVTLDGANDEIDIDVSGIMLDYAGRFELASITTTEIPTNKWGWWWDTINSRLFQVRNRGGVLFAVEATPL